MSEQRDEETRRMDTDPVGRCDTCGSDSVMTVGVLFEDEPISVRMCSECETRTWTRGGERVDISGLVDRFRATTRRS